MVAPGHFVDPEGELLASDLTYALVSYRDTEPIMATEAELADLVYSSLPRNGRSETRVDTPFAAAS